VSEADLGGAPEDVSFGFEVGFVGGESSNHDSQIHMSGRPGKRRAIRLC
jgi:hypothetical protein